MDITIKHRIVTDNIAVVEISGEIDVYTAPRLRDYLIELINLGYIRLVLDIEKAEYLDSTGLGGK